MDIQGDTEHDCWEPIFGVTLDRYAWITNQLAKQGVAGPAAVESFVADHDVAPEHWTDVATGWSQRMSRFPEVRARYDVCVREG
jgi:hypothetical protein